MRHALLTLLFVATSAVAQAQPTPVGQWRTIDDTTHKPRGIVRIFEQGGALYGVVQETLDPAEGAHTCEACSDDRKGKRVLGLDIIRGMKPEPGQGADRAWTGGTILDPESGRTYRCTITLHDGGKLLDVRGYLGISLLGRTQTWERIQ